MFVPSRFLRIAHVQAPRARCAKKARLAPKAAGPSKAESALQKADIFMKAPSLRKPPLKGRILAGCRQRSPKNAAHMKRRFPENSDARRMPQCRLLRAATALPSQTAETPKSQRAPARKKWVERRNAPAIQKPTAFRKLKAGNSIEKRRNLR